MTRYWWVNHKQTARQEIDGRYLWSPKTASNGARNQFYDNMRRANPGDLVLAYANGIVRYVGRVAEFAFTAPKPSEFGSTGAYWHNEGWLLPVFWTELDPPVRPKAMIDVLGPLLPTRYSPIRPLTGDGNQGVYLAEIAKPAFDVVVTASAINYHLLARGGANSLTFAAVKEMLDDHEQEKIRADAGLDTTTKEAVMQAYESHQPVAFDCQPYQALAVLRNSSSTSRRHERIVTHTRCRSAVRPRLHHVP